MKKLLIPLLLCLLAAQSCNMDGTYSVTNAREIVTITDGRLVNDYGVTYTVVETVSTPLTTMEEGKRYYILCDILNINMDIYLKDVTPVTILSAGAVAETTLADPVSIRTFWANSNYVDLVLDYYRDKNGNYAHQFLVQYEWDATAQQLHLYLYHDGNNENPVAMDPSGLDTRTQVISIPVKSWVGLKEVILTYHALVRETSTSPWEIKQITVQ